LPKRYRQRFANVHGSIYSSSVAENNLFAREALKAVSARTITNSLISLAQARYHLMVKKGLIGHRIDPQCGYFVFAEPKPVIAAFPNLLDGNYFGQGRFPTYVRINLLSPKLSPLIGND
jgi:hypothetical protein